MNYKEWVESGSAITLRHPNPNANVILLPIKIITNPMLCKDGKEKELGTYALVDTGATVSAIDSEVAQKLGLVPITKCVVNGVHGASQVDMYSFRISIMDRLNIDVRLATEGQFKSSNFKMLLGMDILRLGEMYLGQEEKDGKCCGSIFSFSVPPTGDVIDFAEKLNKERKYRAKH